MSVLQLPSKLFINAINPDDNGSLLCKFKPHLSGELTNIVVNFVLFATVGSPYTTETLRLKITTSGDHASIIDAPAYAESDEVLVTLATTDTQWDGAIRFDFSKENIFKDSEYYLYLISNNYTRDGDTRFISYVYDNVAPVYSDPSEPVVNDYGPNFIIYINKKR